MDNESKLLDVQFKNKFDFNQKEYAYVIESGSVLATREEGLKTGLLPTHTLEAHDPIGFAEAIVTRTTGFRFEQKSNVILRQFSSSDLRRAVEGANVFYRPLLNTVSVAYSVSQEGPRRLHLKMSSSTKIINSLHAEKLNQEKL